MPLSPDAYAALSDEQKNGAVARAVRWEFRHVHGEGPKRWTRAGIKWPIDTRSDAPHGRCAPQYVTAGDGDPFARWDLLAEMAKLLSDTAGYISVERLDRVAASRRWLVGWRGGTTSAVGETPHRAFGKALAAAGLLEGESDASEGDPR